MSDFEKYVPLKTVVSYTLDEEEQSMGSFDRYWVFAFRGLVDLEFEITAEPITVRLPVPGNKAVPFPQDYISWVKIGVLNNTGEISTLKVNTALTTFKDSNPNRLQKLTADITDSFPLLLNNPFYINYYMNGYFQPMFGVGGGLIQYGECVVDETNNLIVLNPEFRYDHIMLQYISSPEKNGDYVIPTYAQEALIAWIRWKAKKAPRQEYYAAKKEARARAPKKRVNLQNFNQVIRESNGMKLLA